MRITLHCETCGDAPYITIDYHLYGCKCGRATFVVEASASFRSSNCFLGKKTAA